MSEGTLKAACSLPARQVFGDFDLAPFTVSCFLRFAPFLKLTVLAVKDIVALTTIRLLDHWAGHILPSHKLALGSNGRCESGERPVRFYRFKTS